MEKQEQQEGRGVSPAKVIEGWVDPFNIFVEGQNKPEETYCSFEPATLVIGEKAWPESKVKELLIDLAQHSIVFLSTDHYLLHIFNTAKKHGLTP